MNFKNYFTGLLTGTMLCACGSQASASLKQELQEVKAERNAAQMKNNELSQRLRRSEENEYRLNKEAYFQEEQKILLGEAYLKDAVQYDSIAEENRQLHQKLAQQNQELRRAQELEYVLRQQIAHLQARLDQVSKDYLKDAEQFDAQHEA